MRPTRVKLYRDQVTVGWSGFNPERYSAVIYRNRKPGKHEVRISVPGSSLRSYEAEAAGHQISVAGIIATALNDGAGLDGVIETLRNRYGQAEVQVDDYRSFSRQEVLDADLVKVDGYQFYVTQLDGTGYYIIPDLESEEWIREVADKDDVLAAGSATIFRKPLGECQACGVLVPVDQVEDVKTRRATQLDPPEYAEVCEDCADPEPEWEHV